KHEDVFARRNIGGGDALRRLDGQQKEVFLRAFEDQKSALDLLAGQAVLEDEVPIARVLVQGDVRHAQAFPVDFWRMRGGAQLGKRFAAGDVDLNRKGRRG